MTIWAQYDALTSLSNRADVHNVLQKIVISLPDAFTNDEREKAILALLADVLQCANNKSGRLDKSNLQLALLAAKTLGRVPAGSQVIAREQTLAKLLTITKKLRSTDPEAANEALRCVANALLLIEEGRTTWVTVQGGSYCVELLETSDVPAVTFLASRILFFCTVSSLSPLIVTLMEHSPSSTPIYDALSSSSSSKHADVIETIGLRLDQLRTAISQSTTMAKEAMSDLLKFTFNLLVHWPKLVDDTSPDLKPKDKGKGKESKKSSKESESSASEKVLGERWNERLDGLLAPLLRTFLNLPTTSPSPLTAPLTHIIHALIAVPVSDKLSPVWFPEFPPPRPGISTGSSANSSSPPSPSTTASVSLPPGSNSNTKEKESRGAFDRAISRLPRITLSSSRPNSPAPTNRSNGSQASGTAPAAPSSSPPQVLTRAADLLDVALSHYLPGSIDPDDLSVKKRCTDEDIVLDDILSPLVVLLTRLVSNEECRKIYRHRLIPPNIDRTSPLEGRADTLGRCLRLLTSVYHSRLKMAVGEMLFAICDSDAQTLTLHIGYGNAAGFLHSKNIFAPPPGVNSTASDDADGSINPITGMINRPREPLPDMTDEEKEREAEKLFVLFDRLEKAGGMENPIKKALREGKLEKYNTISTAHISDDDDN